MFNWDIQQVFKRFFLHIRSFPHTYKTVSTYTLLISIHFCSNVLLISLISVALFCIFTFSWWGMYVMKTWPFLSIPQSSAHINNKNIRIFPSYFQMYCIRCERMYSAIWLWKLMLFCRFNLPELLSNMNVMTFNKCYKPDSEYTISYDTLKNKRYQFMSNITYTLVWYTLL